MNTIDMMDRGMQVNGPNARAYLIPKHQKDDWDAWVLLHLGDGMGTWTPPIYAVEMDYLQGIAL